MATLSDYTSGTISLANGSVTVTGTGTLFEVTRFREGDTLLIQNLTAVIASVDSDTQLTLTEPWTGTTIVDGPYRARQLGDGSRVSTQAATVIELLGNGVLTNLAELGVEEGKAPVGGPTGEYELVDTSSFGIQDPNGSLGKLAALTLAANKAITTDGSGNAQQSDLGTLGRALLALATGTSAQYVQGDGTLQVKTGLPISTATQTALNTKLSISSGGTVDGAVRVNNALYTYINQTGSNQYSNQVSCFIGDGIASRFMAEHAPGYYYATLIQTAYPGGSREFLFKSDGSFTAPGAIIGAAKNFEIDHPVDPDNFDLRHAATEAPEMLVEYRGTAQLVNGHVTVDVEEHYGVKPGTFGELWVDTWVTALQNQDGFDRLRPSRLSGSVFEIFCENENSNDLVTWVVMARRNDPYVRWDGCKFTDADGKLIIEFEKEDA
ncbi:hypothetical protein WH297_06155 [Ochrobactrum vermis]|uniref:Phage tail protein n=1 Tax=Ochrobactrum vermis TaxID=1827297 RepID=A0ABU8PBA8_9HYPH|nr:hypothetical protein [Ochrobactrum vermis]